MSGNGDLITGALIFGVLLDWIACLVNSLANILMKKDSTYVPVRNARCPRKYLIVATGCFATGGILDVISLAFIPLSVWACNTAVSIPASALLAYFILGEVMKKAHYISMLIILIGSILAIFTGCRSDGEDAYNKFIDSWQYTWNIVLASTIIIVQLICFYCVWIYTSKLMLSHVRARSNETSEVLGQTQNIEESINKDTTFATSITDNINPYQDNNISYNFHNNEDNNNNNKNIITSEKKLHSPNNKITNPFKQHQLQLQQNRLENSILDVHDECLNDVPTPVELLPPNIRCHQDQYPNEQLHQRKIYSPTYSKTLSSGFNMLSNRSVTNEETSDAHYHGNGQFFNQYWFNLVTGALLPAIQTCWTNLLMKCVVELFSGIIWPRNVKDFSNINVSYTSFVCFFCLLISLPLQLLFIKWMMASFNCVVVVPVYQCLMIITTTMFGIVFLGEYPVSYPGFVLSMTISCFGILIMSYSGSTDLRNNNDPNSRFFQRL